MDTKSKYRSLINRVKAEVVRNNKRLTNEDVSFELGFKRGHLDRLLGSAGNPTEEHIKDLLLHFPELLERDTNTTNNDSYQKLQSELESTKELLREKNAIIAALEKELKSFKQLVELKDKLL